MNDILREFEDMRKSWVSDLGGLGEQWLKELQGELGKYVGDVMKDTFDPERLLDFMKRSGVDFTGLIGILEDRATGDPYQILGLDKSAPDELVRKRYHELVRKLHPDTAGVEGTAWLFQRLLAAYEVIKQKRGWQ